MSEFLELLVITIVVTAVIALPAADDSAAKDGDRAAVDYSGTGVGIVPGAPAADGYRMPAEWERHERTIMAFPTAPNWRRRMLPRARAEWVGVARAIAQFEPVTMIAEPADADVARELCGDDIEILELPIDSGWSRDTGPIFLLDGKGNRRAAGFTFNAWGGKFPNVAKDRLVKAHACQQLDVGMYAAPLVLEGGAITVDGQGTLIAVEESVVNDNRNPGVTRAGVEKILADYLGVKKVIWLARGIQPDPITDGHVDGICVFVRPGVVMLQTTDDPEDENFAICRDARKRLAAAKDARGRRLKVIELPMTADEILHVNYYICNGGVIVPVTGDDEQDRVPLGVIRKAFPKHRVVPVVATTIARGGGGIHCITQQVPAITAKKERK